MSHFALAGLVSLALAATSCSSPHRASLVPNGSAKLSAVTLSLPEKSSFPEAGRSRLTGVRVVIEPLDDGCADIVDKTQPWSAPVIESKIKQGCDYSIGVELGQVADGNARLGEVFFTNRSAPKAGQILRKDEFQGKPQVSLKVKVRITDAGKAAGLGGSGGSGGDGNPPPTGAPSTDVSIQVEIEDESPTSGPTRPDEPTRPDGTPAYDWRASIDWSIVPEFVWNGADVGSAYHRDVMSHTEDRYLTSTPTTNAHETMHGLLNNMNNASPERDQFIYFESSRGAYVTEPAMNAARIRDYLPESARSKASSRYQTYLVDQVAAYFPNVLYQLDEWNAYVADSRVAAELQRAGKLESAVDGEVCIVDGAVEFLYFASAAVAALKANEPAYLDTNKQFKAAYAMLAEQSVELLKFAHGSRTLTCTGEDLFAHFVTSPENKPMRDVLAAWMGKAWTKKIFGFG